MTPTNDAFATLLRDPAIVAALEADPELLKQVLLYHVIPAVVPSMEVVTGTVPTANGATVDVVVETDSVVFNDANGEEFDILAINGIIHKIIDKVLLPPPPGGGGGTCTPWPPPYKKYGGVVRLLSLLVSAF